MSVIVLRGKPWDFFHTCFPTTSPSKFPLKDATLHNGVGHCPILVLFVSMSHRTQAESKGGRGAWGAGEAAVEAAQVPDLVEAL